MPRRNVSDRRQLGPHHVYNRASRGRAVFRDDADRRTFLDLVADRIGRNGSISGVDVCAICLMTTHFHLILWQHEPESMRRFMQSVTTAYVRIYNRKYGGEGPLFSGAFRSRYLESRKQLRWAVAYVHANHPSGLDYRFSTHAAYIDAHRRPGWLSVDRALAAFGGEDAYATFMQDHATRAELNARFF